MMAWYVICSINWRMGYVPSGDSSTAAHLNVVLNWTEELKRLVPID